MKRTPGFWLPPVEKPEDAGVGDDALQRLANSIPDFAFQTAAMRAQQMGLEYGNSEIFDQSAEGYDEREDSRNAQTGPGDSANFDSIQDDDHYRIAKALYKSGNPEQSVDLGNGTIAELHTDDLAILFVRQGRSMNHVDIRVARSIRALDEMWSQLVG
jgi:hypothetical protein